MLKIQNKKISTETIEFILGTELGWKINDCKQFFNNPNFSFSDKTCIYALEGLLSSNKHWHLEGLENLDQQISTTDNSKYIENSRNLIERQCAKVYEAFSTFQNITSIDQLSKICNVPVPRILIISEKYPDLKKWIKSLYDASVLILYDEVIKKSKEEMLSSDPNNKYRLTSLVLNNCKNDIIKGTNIEKEPDNSRRLTFVPMKVVNNNQDNYIEVNEEDLHIIK